MLLDVNATVGRKRLRHSCSQYRGGLLLSEGFHITDQFSCFSFARGSRDNLHLD
jgi:hypothetical protein